MDSFTPLRPEDIPPRRRSPGEPDEEDLLTKELFGELTTEPDELTRIIFADVRPATEELEPRTVDLTPRPSGGAVKPALSPREELLRAIEETEEADFELARKYFARPIKESREPRIRSAEVKPRLWPKTSLLKKILLAGVLLGVLGVVSALLVGRAGENFLGSASFVVPNQKETSPLREFWGTFLARDGDYLVVGTNPARNAPIGDEPASYALVQIRGGKVGVAREGTVAELNAALPAKIIPPEPIQALKTSFDFFETGWFFEMADFARAFNDLFTETNGERVDGVALVSSELAARLASASGLSLTPNEPGWVQSLLNSLLTGAREDIIVSAAASRELQFYFFDADLTSQAQRLGLAAPFSNAAGTDSFLVGLRSWEGGRAALELVEYQPQFFVDGSIVSTLALRLFNSTNVSLNVYAKIAVPKGSILLDSSGFADPLPVPSFDYAANGFKENPYLAKPLSLPPGFFSQLDFFEEGSWAVVGGWVRFPPGAKQTLSLRYRLPDRLDWQRGTDTYRLTIFKSGLASEIPFRYQASLVEGVDFEWRQPSGYRADDSAEYQTILRRDETLTATLDYPK